MFTCKLSHRTECLVNSYFAHRGTCTGLTRERTGLTREHRTALTSSYREN